MRRALLTIHIVSSVALLGDVAGFFIVALRASATGDAALYGVLETFSLALGIPLSFTALLSGVALTRVTKWGLLRHRWVTVKLAIIVSVILVGALVLGPATAARDPLPLLLGSGYDVLALSVATGLSVYRPRLGRRAAARRAAGEAMA